MKITVTRLIVASAAMLVLSADAGAQTSTKNLTINGGTGLSGSISGNFSATIKPQTGDGTVQTAGAIFVDFLDIDINGSGILPDGGVSGPGPSSALNIANTSVGINIAPTNFNSSVSGSINVSAGDNLANGVVGALDPGVPGSDGAWDDPGQTGILNNAVVNSATVSADSPINATANVTGGLSFGIANDLLIPDVIDNTFVEASLRLKNSSSFSINFDNVQNISLQNLSFSTSAPVALNTPGSNFTEAAHPVGITQLDLTAGAGNLVETVISGSLSADLTGSVTGDVDLGANVTVIGFIPFSISQDNILGGNLVDPGTTLVSLNEAISLPGVDLPFVFSILHEPTADVDFDDILAGIQSGTFGLEVPFSLSEEVVLPLTGLDFSVENQNFSFDVDDPLFGFNIGTYDVNVNMDAHVAGNIVLDLDADLSLGLDLLATAFEQSAINVVGVPEPTGGLFLACMGMAAGAIARRRRA